MAAFLVGLAKTAIGGLGTISVALYAAVIPTRESTAALLLSLIVGDLVAVCAYHRACDWRLIRHLLPGVLPGLVLGTAVLAVVDDVTLRRGIGALLLGVLLLQLWLRHGDRDRDGDGATGQPDPEQWGLPARLGTGVGAGFVTMVANAAGAVMTLYLVGQRVDKLRFLGTSAWFFLCVNLAKLPFSAGLGLISSSMLATTLLLTPLVIAGGLIGVRMVRRLQQQWFDIAVISAAGLSAVALLVSA